jgi:hypothetical protein
VEEAVLEAEVEVEMVHQEMVHLQKSLVMIHQQTIEINFKVPVCFFINFIL